MTSFNRKPSLQALGRFAMTLAGFLEILIKRVLGIDQTSNQILRERRLQLGVAISAPGRLQRLIKKLLRWLMCVSLPRWL